MSDSKQDQNLSGLAKKASPQEEGKTLSLKGVDPKALQKNSSGSGPLIEHKRRRPANQPASPITHHRRPAKPDRYSPQGSGGHSGDAKSGPTLSKTEVDARQRALSMATKIQFEKEENERKNRANTILLQEAENKIAKEQALLSKDITSSETSSVTSSDANKTNTVPYIAEESSRKYSGPKILGQLKPEDYIGKSRSRRGTASGGNTRSETPKSGERGGSQGSSTHSNNRTNMNSTPQKREGGNYVRPNTQQRDARVTSGGTGNNISPRPAGTHTGANTSPRPAVKRDYTRPQGGQTQDRVSRPAMGGDRNQQSYSNQRVDFATPEPSLAPPARVFAPAKNKTKSRPEDIAQQETAKRAIAQRDRQRKLTVTNVDKADEERGRSIASFRRKLDKKKKGAMQSEIVKVYREVIIPDSITVQELANRMSERSADLVKELMKLGIMATLNKVLDADTAELIVETLGHTTKRVSEADVENTTQIYEDSVDTLKHRAPVVTIMGHVDHGKTSLLDALRKANVVAGEAGGITQHIGAYQVHLENNQAITFIDTPGHAAFSEMRARGAKVTDIVILVVAADDGVMPQTIEAIKHARAADVPIIVAINKIDKPSADPNRIRNELLQQSMVVESMGGDVMEVEVSAKNRINLDGLLEAILLQAEVLELTANPDRFGEGVVIEAKLDKGRGSVATLLMQHGQIKIGDIVVAGAVWGRVRALINDLGEKVMQAGPSVPVEVLGLNGVPLAGDIFTVVENEARAREITEYRERKLKEKSNLATVRTLDNLMSQIKESEMKSMPVIIKGDVQGSVEAISVALEKLGNEEVKVQVVYSGVGGITESDVHLAETAGGIVIGFNVRANKQARDLADNSKIEIRYYSIIYNLIDDIKAALSGMLSPEMRENFLGNAEILEVFDITKVGKVAGCRIREGIARRSAKVRLIRDNVVIHEGVLSTLRRFKDEVKEVQQGYECGMAFEKYHDMRAGDMIEVFEIQSIERKLD